MDPHAEGAARPEITFSASFACPVCGYSIPELEPRSELPEPVREVVLFGSGKEKLKLKLPHEHGGGKLRVFEGIVRNMERRYRETDSNTVREELARCISHQPCPACGGTRLNEAAPPCPGRRAQPRRHQDRRLGHRPWTRGRRQGRRDHRRRRTRADRRGPPLPYRTLSEAAAGTWVVVGPRVGARFIARPRYNQRDTEVRDGSATARNRRLN